MRIITRQIAAAFNAEKSLKVGNTKTDGQAVFLHGNKIVERRSDGVYATLAGWNTPTTRERVNGVTGARFHCVKHEAHLNGMPVGDSDWIKVSN